MRSGVFRVFDRHTYSFRFCCHLAFGMETISKSYDLCVLLPAFHSCHWEKALCFMLLICANNKRISYFMPAFYITCQGVFYSVYSHLLLFFHMQKTYFSPVDGPSRNEINFEGKENECFFFS